MFVNLRSYKELLSQAHKPMWRWSTSWYVKKMIPSVHIPYCYAYSHALVTANHQSLLILIHLSLCVCISMSELRLKMSTTYKEWYIGIVNFACKEFVLLIWGRAWFVWHMACRFVKETKVVEEFCTFCSLQTHGKWEMGQSWLLCNCSTCKYWHVNVNYGNEGMPLQAWWV